MSFSIIFIALTSSVSGLKGLITEMLYTIALELTHIYSKQLAEIQIHDTREISVLFVDVIIRIL